ncbi:MAG: hypothetical protein ACKVP5_19215 [Aestuariivirga sp.]
MREMTHVGGRPILRAALAGLTYFGVVFAAGFALGTLRILVLAPRLGDGLAIGLELPIMLALSWLACRRLITGFDVPTTLIARLAMGVLAFAILMLAELGISTLAFGRSFSAHFDHYRQLPAMLGLAGQITFALFPIIQRKNGLQSRVSELPHR